MHKRLPAIVLILLLSTVFQSAAGAQPPQMPAAQSGTIVFDDSNSKTTCVIRGSLQSAEERSDGKKHLLFLYTSSTYAQKQSTQFRYVFNHDQRSITGNLTGSFTYDEEEGGYDSSEIFVNIPAGRMTWDAAQNVWIFEGDAEIELYLDVLNKVGASGDQIVYGSANLKTNVTGYLTGASGPHISSDGHDSDVGQFQINFNGKNLTSTGSGELTFLEVECYLWTRLIDFDQQFSAASADAPAEEEQETGDAQAAEQEEPFLLDDVNSQLGLFIATYGTDTSQLNHWQGWDRMTQDQQLNLIRFFQRLDTVLALQQPVSPTALALLEEEQRQELLAQRAAELLEDELANREKIRNLIWMETLRETVGDSGVYLYQQIALLQDIKGLYDKGADWIEKLKDPDAAVSGALIDDLLSSAGADKTPEDIAREAIKNINTIATAPSVHHYAYYRENYDQKIKEGLSEEQAHQAGLEALRTRVNDYAAGEFGDPNDRLQQTVWGPATNRSLTEGGIYDRAFPELNYRPAPNMNP